MHNASPQPQPHKIKKAWTNDDVYGRQEDLRLFNTFLFWERWIQCFLRLFKTLINSYNCYELICIAFTEKRNVINNTFDGNDRRATREIRTGLSLSLLTLPVCLKPTIDKTFEETLKKGSFHNQPPLCILPCGNIAGEQKHNIHKWLDHDWAGVKKICQNKRLSRKT